jgi:YbgC/YbaW family acyl-CoA thioester hydrolase
MNLIFRLCWLLLHRRPQTDKTALGPCRTSFRVYPTDLDILRHVNNGKYFSLMDLARIDMITQGGLTRHLCRRGWIPVVTAETIQLKRSLTLFQAFEIETRVVGWDDQAFVLEQQFTRDGKTIATAFVRTRFLSRGAGAVTPQEILTLLGLPTDSPPLPPHIHRWNEDQVHRRSRTTMQPSAA